MTKEQMQISLTCVDIAMQNGGAIDQIIAHGHGRSNRDIVLGLSEEDSQKIWLAIGDVLREKLSAP
jgi:hypothetical protein